MLAVGIFPSPVAQSAGMYQGPDDHVASLRSVEVISPLVNPLFGGCALVRVCL